METKKKVKLEFSAGGIVYKIDPTSSRLAGLRGASKGKIKIALILDSYGRWALPKGHIENKEDPEIAARREIEEEIGLKKLKLVDKLPRSEFWFKFEGKLIHKFLYIYLFQAETSAKLIPQKSEVKDARWLTLEKIKTMELYDSLKEPLRLVERKLQNMIV